MVLPHLRRRVKDISSGTSNPGCYKVLSIRLFTAFPLLQLYYYSIFVSVFIPAANQTVKPFRSKGQLVFKNNTMIVQIGMFEDVR